LFSIGKLKSLFDNNLKRCSIYLETILKHDIVFHQNIKYGSFYDLDRGFLFEELKKTIKHILTIQSKSSFTTWRYVYIFF